MKLEKFEGGNLGIERLRNQPRDVNGPLTKSTALRNGGRGIIDSQSSHDLQEGGGGGGGFLKKVFISSILRTWRPVSGRI